MEVESIRTDRRKLENNREGGNLRKNGYRFTPMTLLRLKEEIKRRYGLMPSSRLAETLQMNKDTLRRILQEDPNIPTVSLEMLQKFCGLLDFALEPDDYEYAKASLAASEIMNPFLWRDCIRDTTAFWGRELELNRLKQFIQAETSCHILGEKRVGKSSLLRQFCHLARTTDGTSVAFLDMNDMRTHSSMGMLQLIADSFGWEHSLESENEFNQLLMQHLQEETHHVICFDHFERYSDRLEDAFEISFWDNMRWVSNQGVSMFTAATKPLEAILSASGKTSPFCNIFLPTNLPRFTPQEARRFVQLKREGIPPFSEDETKEIVEKSRCHPLALQILCYYVLQAKIENESMTLQKVVSQAQAEIERQMKDWEK